MNRNLVFGGIVYALVLLTLCSEASGQQGVQVNTDPDTGRNIPADAANEPTLAVSPVDPKVLIIGWREFPTIQSDARYAGFAYSHDGGATWANGGTLPPPPETPDAEQSDPVLAVNSDGVFHYWSERFRPSFGMFVYLSDDGGQSWADPLPVEDPVTSGDKGWIEIDRSGGIGDGNIYGGWTNYDIGQIGFVRSTDGGGSFTPWTRISDSGTWIWMLHFAVGPDGELYALWRDQTADNIVITKSVNARDPSATPTFNALGAGGVNGLDVIVDDAHTPEFLDINPTGYHQVWVDVDRTDGPRRGHVYCLWADARNDVCDVYFARSEDGGMTWETGIRVNDDPIGNGVYQWMAAMDVAPEGRIDAVWYDTRDDEANWESSLYYSFSEDGGLTWSANRRISGAFDTTLGWPAQHKIGDYNQIISQNDAVNIAYAATFNGEQDVYFMRISPAGELPGIESVASLNEHAGVGAIGVPVDAAAAVEVDSGAVTTESRAAGVSRLEIGFGDPLDASVGSLGDAAVTLTPDPGVAITTSLADGDATLVLEFTPALPDEDTYRMALTDAVIAAASATPGDRDFDIRALLGNVVSEHGAGPQVVNAVDLGLTGIRGRFGADVTAPGNAVFDVTQDGAVNAIDFACVRLSCGVFGNAAP